MKKEEIIEQLIRMAEPEPWEPEITSKAREALYSAIDAIDLTEELLVDVIGAPAMLEQTAEECTELAQACLKYARYLRGENKAHKPLHTIRANFNEELADVAICIDELANGHLIDAHAVEECKQFKYKRMKERMAKDSQ
jgi:NTP pyrophosphatase (non-canonical NTP hydrolase)